METEKERKLSFSFRKVLLTLLNVLGEIETAVAFVVLPNFHRYYQNVLLKHGACDEAEFYKRLVFTSDGVVVGVVSASDLVKIENRSRKCSQNGSSFLRDSAYDSDAYVGVVSGSRRINPAL